MSQEMHNRDNRSIAVLTQFNLEPPAHWGVSRRFLDRKWLEFRLDLMERTSLPSLRHQTFQEFVWVLFVHPESPSWLRERLKSDTSDGFKREIVEILGYEGVAYGTHLEGVLPGRTWLTIKLDSDDLLARNFIERANRESKLGNYCLEDGAYLDVSTMKAYRRHYPSNPFLFRISERGHSVLDEGHHVVEIDYPLRTQVPMWMQFHHGDNVSPDWRPLRMLARRFVEQQFQFPELVRLQDPPKSSLKRLLVYVRLRKEKTQADFQLLVARGLRLMRRMARKCKQR